MKKTYIQPTTQQTEVKMVQMVCESGPKMGGTTNGDRDLLSRQRGNVWDDEE